MHLTAFWEEKEEEEEEKEEEDLMVRNEYRSWYFDRIVKLG